MLNFGKKIIAFITLLTMNSCFSNIEEGNKRFVEKHYNDNFNAFINTGFLIRSEDGEGNLIIFISTDLKNALNKGPYVVTVEKETGVIKKTSTHLMSDSNDFNREALHKLLPLFLTYKIYSIAVDSNQNVYVRVMKADKPTLVRFSNKKYITEQYKDWKRVKGNWYENLH
jgi:hypothetical protein